MTSYGGLCLSKPRIYGCSCVLRGPRDEREQTGRAGTEMLWGLLGLGGGMMHVRGGKAERGTKVAGIL